MILLQRIRSTLSWVLAIAMFSVFFYGIIRFPDGPIHPCPDHGYCGKQGQPHTLQDFIAFRTWETTIFYLWPIGLVTLVLLRRKRHP
jgi:hypothetical protein